MKSKTALHVAAKYGHKEVVEWLLNVANADLEKRDRRGLRALHYAADNANHEVLKILIDRGAELNSQTRLGRTALYLAARKQFPNCIRVLLDHGCDVNIQDMMGNSPLHHCVCSNVSLKVIEVLVSSGRINWTLLNKDGYNVLHLAVMEENLELVRFILETSPKKRSLLFQLAGEEKDSSLHIACHLQNFQLAKLVVQEAGTRSDFKDFLHAKDGTGSTALMVSCQQKDYATVELLIKAGANLLECDRDNDSAIMLAAYHTLGFIVAPIAKEAPSIFASHRRQAPAIRKIMDKHPILFLILYLIEHGCNWDAINRHGETAALILGANGYKEDVIELINDYAAQRKTKSRNIRNSVRPSQQLSSNKNNPAYSSSEEDAV